MREELSRAKAALVRACPFVASMLMRVRIAKVPRLPPPGERSPAGVTADGTLVIAEEEFGKLEFWEKVAVLCHQALHLALLHPQRAGERDRVVWNIAADALVNRAVRELSLPLLPGSVNGESLRVEGWEKMSTEELYEELAKRATRVAVAVLVDLLGPGSGLPGGEGEVVQEGDRNLYDPSAGREELERRWREAVAAALMAQKTAGRLPAGVERLFDEVLKPRISVRALLRQVLRRGLGRMVVSDWSRTSRKNPDLPGVKRLAIPNVWALVDTSGSIDERELSLFVGTLLEFSGQTRVQVICWDGEAYEPIKLRGRSVEPLRGRMRGGGGTVIRPALERTLRQMRPLDMVVVLTDGHIYDWDMPDTKSLLSRVAARASVSVLLWTDREVSHPRWRSLRLH